MRPVIYLLPVLAALPLWAGETPDVALEEEARAVAGQFASQLKPRLQAALREGGPSHAIEICATQAPKIADALSTDTGWRVKRVSLKARNASRAITDAWEKQVLEEFDRRRAAGEEPASLNYGEQVGGRYRYMQAQVVEPVCLTCHAETLSEPVRQTLEQYYPDDYATGYSLGQVRGAFSLSTDR